MIMYKSNFNVRIYGELFEKWEVYPDNKVPDKFKDQSSAYGGEYFTFVGHSDDEIDNSPSEEVKEANSEKEDEEDSEKDMSEMSRDEVKDIYEDVFDKRAYYGWDKEELIEKINNKES